MNNHCQNLVILAAGMSSRMKQDDPEALLNSVDLQQANQLTKGLISIGKQGQVLIDYVINNAFEAGVKNIYLITGIDNSHFKEHFKNYKKELNIYFAIQHIPSNRVKPLGTADAVFQLLEQYPVLKKSSFVVCNSDNLYSVKAFKALCSWGNQALISYDRGALDFSEEQISKFAIISSKNNEATALIEKPNLENLNQYADADGKIRVSMNIFKLSGSLIYPFVKNCPLHPIRQEKELPSAINRFLKEHPLSFKAIPLSEHVPDLTSKADISKFRLYLSNLNN